jgi:membrane protein required for colicin V production
MCLLVLAVFKGFRKGLVVAVFSLIAIVVGLAAALKLSAVVAQWLGTNINVNARFLPILAFILVMLVVAWLVRLCGLLIQKALQIAMLGFINRLAGIILYAILYTILLSVILFYAGVIKLVGQDTIEASNCYPFLEPWGPAAIDVFAKLSPAFENIFQQLEHFFDNIAKKGV